MICSIASHGSPRCITPFTDQTIHCSATHAPRGRTIVACGPSARVLFLRWRRPLPHDKCRGVLHVLFPLARPQKLEPRTWGLAASKREGLYLSSGSSTGKTADQLSFACQNKITPRVVYLCKAHRTIVCTHNCISS